MCCCATAAVSAEDTKSLTVVSQRPDDASLTVIVFHTIGVKPNLVRLNRLHSLAM